jgi:hypothetical protein
MGSDFLSTTARILFDPLRINSTILKKTTGKSWETMTGENKAKDNAAAVAAGTGAKATPDGNLTDEEASKASSSRLYRIGSFFTSPTGVLNSSTRRGAKLLGQ